MRLRFVAIPFVLLLAAGASLANAGAPNFGPAIYGDGEVWGTKGVSGLPAPNGSNDQSFDKLFVVVNGAPGQMPVAEAAPGNRAYNGGRWFTHTVMWTAEGLAAHDPLPVLTSYTDIQLYQGLGQLAVAAGSPSGGPPPYFECPLLPVH